MLFSLGLDPKLPAIDVGDGSAETMIGFAAIQRLLDVLPQTDIVDIVEDVKSPAQAIKFPQCFLGLVLADKGIELADQGRLGHILLREGSHEALNVRPLPDDQPLEHLAGGFNEIVSVVTGRMEANQCIHLFMQIPVAGCELVAKHHQDPEVNLVGSMGVSRMSLRPNLRHVVVEQVEDEMALVLVGTDDFSVDRDVVSDQCVGGDTFLETEVLPGVVL